MSGPDEPRSLHPDEGRLEICGVETRRRETGNWMARTWEICDISWNAENRKTDFARFMPLMYCNC